MTTQLLDKNEAQLLLGEKHVLADLRQEPSTFVDSDGNPAEANDTGAIERPGTVLVSNGQIVGRGATLELAVADLLAHYLEAL